MADASQVFSITVPPGNGSTTPATYPLPLGLAEVVTSILTWPAGCSGLVGVALLAGGSWAFPYIADTYMAFDDFVYPLGITNQIQTGDWALSAYNSDYYPHTIQVVMEYDYVITDQTVNTSLQVSM
jgi:hypothetical protein